MDNYHGVDINTEREHLQEAIEIHQQVCGNRPLGWYTGRTSENTRTLLNEEGDLFMTQMIILTISHFGLNSRISRI